MFSLTRRMLKGVCQLPAEMYLRYWPKPPHGGYLRTNTQMRVQPCTWKDVLVAAARLEAAIPNPEAGAGPRSDRLGGQKGYCWGPMIPANGYSIHPRFASTADCRHDVVPTGAPRADGPEQPQLGCRESGRTARTALVALYSRLQVRPSVSHGNVNSLRSRFVAVQVHVHRLPSGIGHRHQRYRTRFRRARIQKGGERVRAISASDRVKANPLLRV